MTDRSAAVVAALRRRHDAWMADLLTVEQGLEDPRDRILAVFGIRERSEHGGDAGHCDGTTGVDGGRLRSEHARHLGRVQGHVAGLCAEAGLPSHLAEAVVLLVQGARLDGVVRGHPGAVRAARTAAAVIMSVYDRDASATVRS